MTDRISRLQMIEPRLELIAKAVWPIMFLCALVVFIQCLTFNAAMRARLEAAEGREQILLFQGRDLHQQIQLSNTRMHAVAAEVSSELDRKKQLRVTMAEVIARANVLQDQRSRFADTKSQVLQQFKLMDQRYERARQQVPSISPG